MLQTAVSPCEDASRCCHQLHTAKSQKSICKAKSNIQKQNSIGDGQTDCICMATILRRSAQAR